jgi:hypothetical protein
LAPRPLRAAALDLVPARDPGRGWPAAMTVDAIAAADALKAALRDVPCGAIGVIGRGAGAGSEWLRQMGHDAAVLAGSRRKSAREKSAARPPRRLEVIVGLEWLEYEQQGPEAVRSIGKLLEAEGRLIVIVPNLTHASVRLAILQGRHPFATSRSPRARLFTAEDVERILNEAGFIVTAIERQVDSSDSLKKLAEGVPAAVLDMFAGDADALTTHFALVAQPEGASAAAMLHRRVRALADDSRASARITHRLDDRIAALEVRVQHWAAEMDALADPGVPTHQALAALDARVQQLGTAQGEIAHDAQRALAALERIGEQQAARDAGFHELAERLSARSAELEALVRRIERHRYQRLISRIQQIVGREVPRGAVVAVVSRGDDALLAFGTRKGWHFPQTDAGVYAGHHPADSEEAIAQLERVRRRGARYLLIPRTAFWWLDHYRAFHDHLQRRHTCAFRDDHTCALFALRGGTRTR